MLLSLHPMHPKDLALLASLDILLTEGSVAKAAERMNLSTPAMSRVLGRIRALTGDPILVRAGRGLVPTPRAETMRAQLRDLIEAARTVLEAAPSFDPSRLDRRFTLRATDGFVATFGTALIARLRREAPNVVIRFVQQGDENVADLRDGRIDLDIATPGGSGPEIMVQSLFVDRFIGVVRPEHPLATREITLARFCRTPQISASRRGRPHGPLDAALEAQGHTRPVVAVVAGFIDAVLLARQTDLLAVVPERLTRTVREGMTSFPLPVATPPVTVAQTWHPRVQADPAHRWLRARLRQVCADSSPIAEY
ncbi:LysR family transcriptional regulator [Gluconacetobacter sacchari]|uniref:LysR family transcriptional regulator n=1 Tax=Gluconacetobacter sacchari TaxID=92759 RepID=UPI0039B69379